MRAPYITILLFLSSFMALGQGFRQIPLKEQAENAFEVYRWKSAGTLYDLLLVDSTSYTPLMARALFANVLANDSLSISRAKKLFYRNYERVDSLLKDFKKLCVLTKRFDLYESALSELQKEYPDKKKFLQLEMIHFRFFLRQPDEALLLIDESLNQEGRSLEMLDLKGEAFQLKGESDRALAVYRSILAIDPLHINSNLYLGNYYYVYGFDALSKLNDTFSQLSLTIRMRDPAYLRQANTIWKVYLSHAYSYLDKVAAHSQNTQLLDNLKKLQAFKDQLDFANGFS